MPEANELHYKLLRDAVNRYVFEIEGDSKIAPETKEAAMNSIVAARQAAELAGYSKLEALCDSAERIVAKD